jgi:hypothetical protein
MRAHDESELTGETRKPPERAEPGPMEGLLRLQSLAGNRGVTAMLSQDPAAERDEAGPDAAAGPDAVAGALASGGRPLDDGVRSDMEQRLGGDFSGVRVHTGDAATGSAKSLGANAYTVGRDIVFQGDWDPGSDKGRRTLAHELTHVMQQSAGPVDGADNGGGLRVSDPGDRFEQEAERSADAAMSAPAPVQRQEEALEDEEEPPVQTSLQREEEAPEEEEEVSG